MLNIKDFLSKQSVIQITLYKITLSIFVFLVTFTILYGKNYWEKEAVKTYSQLFLISSDVQSNIQSKIITLESVTKQNNLTIEQKTLKIKNLLGLDDKNIGNHEWGYYDLQLDYVISTEDLDIKDIANNVRATAGREREFHKFTWENNSYIIFTLPVYYQGEIVGYAWSCARSGNIVFESTREVTGFMISVLGLSILVLLSIRKQMKQIRSYLEKFCKMIMDNEYENEQIITKLPELESVLSQITYYTGSLKQRNEELKESKLQTIKIMEGISDGFYALDREWKFTFVNHKLKLVSNTVELVGKRIWEVFPELTHSITYHKMQEAMSQNESVHWEAGGFADPDQNQEYHAYPYKEGLTVFFRDVTELKRQQRELGRLERLNLIGQLAAGISHEIRNPLTTVKGFLQLFEAKSQYAQDKEYLELMIAEIDRANSIITNFLSLAKANIDNISSCNINQVINHVFPMLQADAFNSNKEVATDLETLPDILMNENEIKQLILNLVRNGLEVTAEHGSVMICTYLKGDRVVLAIKDQGNGIPEDIQDKIGTPFFTTKETGTGLGLAISMGIAERHNAVFRFETGNDGTTFYTLFPTSNT